MAPPELYPDYYWRNLCTVVDTVLAAQPALFGPEHHALFDAWRRAPRPAQLLHSRLLLRKGPDFRRSSLVYEEVGALAPALAVLAEGGLVTLAPPLAPAERLALYTVPELKAVGAALGLALRGRRPALVEALLAQPPTAVEAACDALDPVVRRHGGSAFSRAQVVFFGNRHQDMSTFVRVALDQLKYAEYQVDRGHPLFPDREALDAYLAAGARWDAAFEARMAGDEPTLVGLGAEAAAELAQRPPVAPFRARVDPARADSRVVYRAARAHEGADRRDQAEALYGLLLATRRHLPTAARAGDRLGLMRQRARATADLTDRVAPLLAEPGLDDPSRRLLQRRLRLAQVGPDLPQPVIPEREITLRGADRTAPESTPRPPTDEDEGRAPAGGKALYYAPGGEVRTVEEAALEALGGDGVWCEGGLYTTLFALLCWDVIFAPVPGAFQHPFQDAPVDYDTALFYLRREARFLSRFAILRESDLAREVARAWQTHQGRACRGVWWDRFPPALLTRAAAALGPRLVDLLARLARHPARHGAGLPDLLVFTSDGPHLIEVKGPGDQPSVEQQLWHAYLVERGLPFTLLRVRRA